MSTTAQHAYDPADPHGFHAGEGHDHGHVIVPWQTLLGVLLVLLALTVVTVVTAQIEAYAAHEWGWTFPAWLNIVIAMAIATVKGALVVLYFMQLRYDKGINAILFLFTLFAVWLFLMFTMIDLNGRGTINEWRAGEITSGGTGVGVRRAGMGGGPLYQVAKENYIAEHGQDAYDSHKHGYHADESSSKDLSRARTGLTPGLFDSGPWTERANDKDHDGHSGGH
ncbi:MAG: cytochrome C oxidase subunit IV family protein [Phycisphaerales bacterium]